MKALFTFIIFTLSFLGFSQICTIDFTQNTPGVYPDTLLQGKIGVAYEEEINLLFPTQDGGVNFTSFQIVGVELPTGLTLAMFE